jgi:hypothetical protein
MQENVELMLGRYFLIETRLSKCCSTPSWRVGWSGGGVGVGVAQPSGRAHCSAAPTRAQARSAAGGPRPRTQTRPMHRPLHVRERLTWSNALLLIGRAGLTKFGSTSTLAA